MKNKYQEALDIISSRCVETSDNDEKQMDLLQELVDKATPKKLKNIEGFVYNIKTGKKVIETPFINKGCPSCDNLLRTYLFQEIPNYCPNCGQHIDRSD